MKKKGRGRKNLFDGTMMHAVYFDNTVFIEEGGSKYGECGKRDHHRERKVHGTYMCRRGCAEEANTSGRRGTMWRKGTSSFAFTQPFLFVARIFVQMMAGNQHIQISAPVM